MTASKSRDIAPPAHAPARTDELLQYVEALHGAIDLAPVVLWTTDRTGTVQSCRGGGSPQHGVSPADALGRSVFELYADAPAVTDHIRTALAGQVARCTFETAGKPYALHCQPVRAESGAIIGVVGLVFHANGGAAAPGTDHESGRSKAVSGAARKDRGVALQASEQEYRDLIEKSLQGILIRRGEKPVFVNQTVVTMLGYSRPEDITSAETIEPFVAPHERESLRRRMDSRARGSRVPSLREMSLMRKDGVEIAALVSSEAILWGGEPATLTTLVDSTTQKRVERELRQSQQLLQTIVDAIPHRLMLKDRQRRILMVNRAMVDAWGGQPADFIGKLDDELLEAVHAPRERREQVSTSDLTVLDSGRPLEHQIAMISKSGAVHLRTIKVPVYDTNGAVAGVLALSEDISDKVLAEQNARDTQGLLQQVFDALPYDAYVKDTDGRILLVNTAMSARWRTPTQGMIGRLLHELTPLAQMPPAERKAILDTDAELLATGRPVVLELDRVTHEGPKWMRTIKVPIRNSDGAITRILGLAEDRTDSRRAEQQLKHSQRFLRQVLDAIPMWIFAKDLASTYTLVNKVTCDIFGLSREDLEGRHTSTLPAPPAMLDKSLRDDQWVVDNRAVLSQQTENVRRADGRLMYYHSTKLPLYGETGELIGVLGVNRDVTEQKALEDSLRLKQHAIMTAVEAIAFLDLTWRFTEVNDAFLRLWKLDRPADVIGRRAIEFLWTEKDAALAHHSVQATQVWVGDTSGLRHDGSRFPIDVRISTVPDSEGQPALRMMSVVDRTDARLAEEKQRELEESLFQVQKLESVGRLAGGIAHDLNNTLTPILGHAEMVLSAMPQGHAQHDSVQVILASADRAAALVRQLLTFSQQRVLRKSVISVKTEIESVMGILRRVVRENILVDVRVAEDIGTIEADPTLFHQVLMNLVVNAQDAMPEGGRLAIDAANSATAPATVGRRLAPGPYVVLTISDTGQGMTPEVLGRVFEPFFTTKPEGKGTGLGLSVVYGIVAQHLGHIAATSQPGKGTTFTIHLPRSDLAPPLAAEAVLPIGDAGHEAILLVEDDDAIRAMVESVLTAHGYNVISASDPAQAMARLDPEPGALHLLLTDVVMPHGSGPDLYARLLKSRPTLKVIYMSGYASDLALGKGREDAKAIFLEKPFSLQTLLQTVRNVLD
jgi:two-component system, cell cycle sensor histidine kinase and response regulator CckA